MVTTCDVIMEIAKQLNISYIYIYILEKKGLRPGPNQRTHH